MDEKALPRDPNGAPGAPGAEDYEPPAIVWREPVREPVIASFSGSTRCLAVR